MNSLVKWNSQTILPHLQGNVTTIRPRASLCLSRSRSVHWRPCEELPCPRLSYVTILGGLCLLEGHHRLSLLVPLSSDMSLFQVSMAGYTELCIHMQRVSYEWRTDDASRRLFTLQTTLCLDLICCRGCIKTYSSTSLSPFPLPSSYRYHWCGCRSHTNIGSMFYELLVFKNPNGRAPMSDDLPVLPVRLLDSLSVGPTWACQHKNSGFSNFRWDSLYLELALYDERCRSALQFRDSDTRPLCILDDLLELRFRYYERTCTLGRDHGSKIQTQHFGALTSIYPRIDKDWMPRTLKWDISLVFNYTCSFKRSDGLHFPGRCYHFSLIGYDE